MARRAQSTIPVTVIFVARGNRRNESQRGLAALDIPLDGQIYLGLRDGELWRHQEEIEDKIVSAVIGYDIGHIMTLGADGYDQHPDHITSHLAAANAARTLRTKYSRDLGMLSLNSGHSGHDVVVGTPFLRQRKLGALASHQSQFPVMPLSESGINDRHVVVGGFAVDPDFWDSFSQYQALIMQGETYDYA